MRLFFLHARKAIVKMSKFRSHCNSFFVEFILKCCVGENMPEGVVTLLLDFVRGNPNKQGINNTFGVWYVIGHTQESLGKTFFMFHNLL